MNNASSGLPASPSLYEREYRYWPWGELIERVAQIVIDRASPGARILDYMCGTGYLLHRIAQARPDVKCTGCSITPKYIAYAKEMYPDIVVDLCDARTYKPRSRPDIVLCTAGIHHLPWEEQGRFIEKVASEMVAGTLFVIGEELVPAWTDETSRRKAVLALHSDLFAYVISRAAPIDVLTAVVDVLRADLQMTEFKINEDRLRAMIEPFFSLKQRLRVWPADRDTDHGDFVFVSTRRA